MNLFLELFHLMSSECGCFFGITDTKLIILQNITWNFYVKHNIVTQKMIFVKWMARSAPAPPPPKSAPLVRRVCVLLMHLLFCLFACCCYLLYCHNYCLKLKTTTCLNTYMVIVKSTSIVRLAGWRETNNDWRRKVGRGGGCISDGAAYGVGQWPACTGRII